MTETVPAYYGNFRCIASACRHSCCIGWEIDIDGETADYYETLSGPWGDRLRENIEPGEPASFRLGAEERCPFLNEKNLCELILNLGEESLCEICSEHPRFHNCRDDRVESGLGLCCEAAAALILGQKEPFSTVTRGGLPEDGAVFALRDKVLTLLTDRSKPLERRCGDTPKLCGGRELSKLSPGAWLPLYRSLEQMEPDWTAELECLEREYEQIDFATFRAAAADWETEYEQLLCYFTYRHFCSVAEEWGAAAAMEFSVLSCGLIYALQAMEFHLRGAVDFEKRVELAREYSAEIEYSDENPFRILEALF